MPLRREAALASKSGPKHAKKPQKGEAKIGEKEKKEKKVAAVQSELNLSA